MAVSATLEAFLRGAHVKYTIAKHPVVYTAQEIAAAQHVPGRQLAKSVLVKTARGPVLAVLCATHRIDLKKLKTALNAGTLSIAGESDIKRHFPDVEVGAMSPFGQLYQVPVVVDRLLGASDQIVFNAGSHTETITLRYQDFAQLAKPKVALFSQPVQGAPKKAARKGVRRPAASRAKPRRKPARRPSSPRPARRRSGRAAR